MAPAGNPVIRHAIIAAPMILATSALALPVSAALLDNHPRLPDNGWIPLGGALMLGSVSGAAIGAALPGIAGSHASHVRGALVGAGFGAVATTAAIAGLALLLQG